MLIIEDGSNVAGANSYVTDAQYISYAASRGLTIGSDSVSREIELIRSMDYLFSREEGLQGMQGERTTGTQENVYPRQNVYIRNIRFASDAIPIELKNAQMEGGIAANTQSLLINSTSQNVAKEKLATLEVEYFSGGSWENVRLDRVINYLKPLLKNQLNRLTRI